MSRYGEGVFHHVLSGHSFFFFFVFFFFISFHRDLSVNNIQNIDENAFFTLTSLIYLYVCRNSMKCFRKGTETREQMGREVYERWGREHGMRDSYSGEKWKKYY